MTAREQWLHVELLTEVVLSSTSATVGASPSLGHIPGGLLLGACAARLYGELVDAGAPEDAWTLFHSGKVCFGTALPVAPAGGATIPMPMALHHPKGKAPFARGWLAPCVVNLARAPRATGSPPADPPPQQKQLRSGYLGPDGDVVHPARHGTTRTALTGGRARDGFLYHLDALVRGQVFLARLTWDEDVDDGLVRRAIDALTARPIRVGRSRSAEFGRARVTCVDPPAAHEAPDGGLHAGDEPILLVLASDLALRDPRTGAPSLQPDPAALLGETDLALALRWDRRASFLRHRRYSPFNSHRSRPDLERQVLQQGSVIALRPAAGQDRAELVRRLVAATASGIGLHRAEGLGAVLVEPAILARRRPAPGAGSGTPGRPGAPVPGIPSDSLGEWVQERVEAARRHHLAEELAFRYAHAFARWKPPLPAAQWGEVRWCAAQCTSRKALHERLFYEPPKDGDRRGKRRASRLPAGPPPGMLVSGVARLRARWGKTARVDPTALDDGEASGEARRISRADLMKHLVELERFDSKEYGPGCEVTGAIVLEAVQILALEVPRLRAAERRPSRPPSATTQGGAP